MVALDSSSPHHQPPGSWSATRWSRPRSRAARAAAGGRCGASTAIRPPPPRPLRRAAARPLRVEPLGGVAQRLAHRRLGQLQLAHRPRGGVEHRLARHAGAVERAPAARAAGSSPPPPRRRAAKPIAAAWGMRVRGAGRPVSRASIAQDPGQRHVRVAQDVAPPRRARAPGRGGGPAATSRTSTRLRPVSTVASIRPRRKSRMTRPVGVGRRSPGPDRRRRVDDHGPLPARARPSPTSISDATFERLYAPITCARGSGRGLVADPARRHADRRDRRGVHQAARPPRPPRARTLAVPCDVGALHLARRAAPQRVVRGDVEDRVAAARGAAHRPRRRAGRPSTGSAPAGQAPPGQARGPHQRAARPSRGPAGRRPRGAR